jgi:transcriptional regulator with XRE-family HTH domain
MRLKELRESAGLSQYQLAKILGIQRSTYSSYEYEDRAMPYRHLFALADYYGTTTDYILDYRKKAN